MRRLTFTARASEDLVSVREHIARDRPAAAEAYAERLLQACASPLDFAEIGKVGRRAGTRELATVWPYVIVYRVSAETVRIERIIHGARRR